MPPPSNPFRNPIEGVSSSDLIRTSIVFSRRTQSAIHKVYTSSGVMQTTANILLDKLANELNRTHLNDYDPSTYKHAIANAFIVLPGSPGYNEQCLLRSIPVGQPASGVIEASAAEVVIPDDGRGTQPMALNVPGNAQLPVPDLTLERKGSKSKKRKSA